MVAGRVSAWRAAAAVFVLCCVVLYCVVLCLLVAVAVCSRASVSCALSLPGYAICHLAHRLHATLHDACYTMLLCSQSVPIGMYTVPYHGTQGTQVHLGLH